MSDQALRSTSLPGLLPLLPLFAWAGLWVAPASAQPQRTAVDAPIATALAELPEDVRVYNDHVVFLASPYLEGRIPGSRGMEIAKDYMQHYFEQTGLEPAFEADGGGSTFRQPFPLAGTSKLLDQHMSLNMFATNEGTETWDFVGDKDFNAMGLGGSAEVTAPATFVGYSIASGPNDYTGYNDGDDLTGQVAVMFRFEPMDADGKSRWSEESPWTARASFNGKVRAAADRGAAAIVIINPPGAADERAQALSSFTGGGGNAVDCPVFMMTTEAASSLLSGAGSEHSLIGLREMADEGRAVMDLGFELSLKAEIEKKDFVAENVGGVLRGRGELADQWIVVGAHLDHLGMGFFGSRDRESAGRELHPGADDNASGCAGVLLIAEDMKEQYAALPEDQPLRSVLFLAFSAEESGLVGARHYVNNPIADIELHSLMMNFDMIGRITNKRLSVSGTATAKGMQEWIEPILEASPLEIVASGGGSGGSDHLVFQQKQVPVLFAIIADFHDEYHTPRDTSDKINRVDAVQAAYLWRDIAMVAAQRSGKMEFNTVERPRGGATASRGGIKVRFGIQPGNYEEGIAGIPVAAITTGGAAEAAGLEAGDHLVTWDGKEIGDVQSWMGMLRKHNPGDEVMVGVVRAGEPLELKVKLKAANTTRG